MGFYMKIIFTEDALDIMLLSSVEKYKSEVIGLLFGQFRPSQSKILVSFVLPLVTAKTSPAKADYNEQRIKRVLNLFSNLRNQNRRFLGFYHSHPQFGDNKGVPKMSKDDIESFSLTPEAEIEVIIAINNYQRKVTWESRRDGTLSGTIDEYFFKIAGYSKQDTKFSRELVMYQ